MPRLLYAPDAPVPIAPDELPCWLRPGAVARVQLGMLSAVNGVVRMLLNRLSHDSGNRLARLRKRFVG